MRLQTRFPRRRSFPDLTPTQVQANLRAASTADLQEAVTRNAQDFPVWMQSPQLRHAMAIMREELRQRGTA